MVKTSRDNPLHKQQKKRKKTDECDEDKEAEPPSKKRRIDDGNNNNYISPPPMMNMPASPRTMCDNRDICQYDKGCYRKNMDHFKEYQHPNKESNESNVIRAKTKTKVEEINKRRQALERAAGINKEKQLKKAKEEFDVECENVQKQYQKIMDKAQNEFDEKLIPIKQSEQFELEKIEKKYHPH